MVTIWLFLLIINGWINVQYRGTFFLLLPLTQQFYDDCANLKSFHVFYCKSYWHFWMIIVISAVVLLGIALKLKSLVNPSSLLSFNKTIIMFTSEVMDENVLNVFYLLQHNWNEEQKSRPIADLIWSSNLFSKKKLLLYFHKRHRGRVYLKTYIFILGNISMTTALC